jgi:hypothetical protein
MLSENIEVRIKNIETKLNKLGNNDDLENKGKNDNYFSVDNLILVQKGILFFLLIISGNYIGELLSCRTQTLFTNNMYSKHIIALISLYFFVIVSDSKLQKYNPIITLFGTIFIYIYFLCISKVESKYFIIILVVLTLIAFTQIYKEYLENTQKLSNFEKKIKQKINLIQQILIGLTFIVTLIGLLIYLGMKKIEYKSKFNYKLFLLGKHKCLNNLIGSSKYFKNIKGINMKNITPFFLIKTALGFVPSNRIQKN